MFRKRRTCPLSSRKCDFKSGNFSSRTENRSSRFVAAQVREPTPAVWRRNAVGICTVIGMTLGCSHTRGFRFCNDSGNLRWAQRLLQVRFELGKLRSDRALGLIDAGEHVGGLQTVARHAEHSSLFGQDAVLTIQLACCAYGNSA